MQYAGRLRIEDAIFRKIRRFVLETGEPVRRVDFDHYWVAKTGKRLVRIDSSI
ncbi:MAG TPA: hypothetical protein VHU79_01095 [Sphingomicrobium sp.]|nr:hypothetical protein [Sphingomicrobium sp.]